MSIVTSGGTVLSGPSCRPARYGLLSVAEIEDRAETDEHWQAGFSWDVPSCEDLIVTTACPPLPENKEGSQQGVDTFDGDPFALVAGYKCSAQDATHRDPWDMANDRLDRGESRTLERVFWQGEDLDGNDVRGSLRHPGSDFPAVDVTPTAGTAVSITDGFALLESFMGDCYPCEPIIHAQRGIGVYLAERSLVKELDNDGILRSVGTGSRVAIGGGYQRTGPDGTAAADGTAWLYATGAIKVIRSAPFSTPERGDLGGAINRQINDVEVFAERVYGFQHDCCVAAVLVNLKSCCC